jgi:septal ring factor EnvC (AmiA/AmiB activator)
MRFHLIISFWLAISTCAAAMAADDQATDYQLKLDGLRTKITNLVSDLGSTKSKRNDLRQELQKLEVRIAKVAIALRGTEHKHKLANNKLASLRQDLGDIRVRLDQQRRLLAGQLRAAYTLGQQPQLKLVLSQKVPAEMGRAMVYFDYLNRTRNHEILSYLASIEHKQAVEADIEKAVSQLTRLAAEQKTQKKQLDENRVSRKALIERLNQDIEQQQLALQDLEDSRNRIEKLLMSLGELMADIPASAGNDQAFAALKGKLPWPVRGSFNAEFGESRSQGGLKWNGVLIHAAYGTPVHAITSGRVEFADWLQGFGFITIVNHNDGYMSLYGHNQALYKKAGDWVEAGETIATVGDSGGYETSGLYFEIRYQGKPVNPKQWCSASARHLAKVDE